MTQEEAFKVLTMGKNVFLTGAAGSGKTHLLNTYIEWLEARGIEVAVTASTGIAATHIGGQTIHSWSGIGIKERLSHFDLDLLGQNEQLHKRFSRTNVLIIDEVSMLSAGTLAMVNDAIQAVTHNHEPFGGMQVVLCGDFFQLPPIVRGNGEISFSFMGEAWTSLEPYICYLSEQFRQDDHTLLGVLHAIRNGEVTDEHRKILSTRLTTSETQAHVPHLYTHNIDVNQLNLERLAQLTGDTREYRMHTRGSKKRVDFLKKGLLVPEVLVLKKDAVVMFVKNDLQGKYVNGTLGTVQRFAKSGYPIVKTLNGKTIEAEPDSWRIEEGDKVKAEISQVPLRLAWAVTIHKSQGITLDAARIDLSKTFVAGQGYVALSRVRSLEGLFLEGFNELAFERDAQVAHRDMRFLAYSEAIARRLNLTPQERILELTGEFVEQCGGHAPDPTGKEKKKRGEKSSSAEKTSVLVRKKMSLKDMAKERGVVTQTIVSHLEQLVSAGVLECADISYLKKESGLQAADFKKIDAAFSAAQDQHLGPVRNALKNAYSFESLRFGRLFFED